MTRPYDVHVIDAQQTPNITGDYDYTVSGVGGTPVGCLVMAVRATGATGVDETGMASSWGVTDGTNTYVHSTFSRDSVTTADSGQSTSTDLVRIIDPATQAEEVVGEFVSFISNGIRIKFSTVNASVKYRFVVILYFGSGTSCHAFWADTPTVSGAATTVTCGFEADFILTSTANTGTTGAISNGILTTYGIAVNDGSDSVCSAGLYSRDNVTTTDTYRPLHQDRLGTILRLGFPLLFGGQTVIDNYTSTSFEVDSSGPSSTAFGPDIIGLAVGLPSTVSYTYQPLQTFESSTGSSTRSGLGFLPGFWYTTHSAASATGFSSAGAVALGVSDASFNQAGIALADQNSVTTTKTRCHYDGRVHSMDGHSGNDLERGIIQSRDEGEYTLNIGLVTGTPRRYHMLVVEELPFLADTTGGLPSMSASIVAEELFDAEATAALSAASASAVAELLFDSEVSLALPSVSASATAELLLDSDISVTLAPMSASAVAELLLEASVDANLPASSASVVAELLLDAEVTATLSAASASAVAEQLIEASTSAQLPSAAASAVAELLLDAAITAGLPAASVDIAAEQLLTEAEITTGLPSVSASAVAELLLDAVITIALPSASVTVVGDVSAAQVDAEIDAQLGAASASVVAEQILDAAITTGLPAIAASLEAASFFDVQAAPELPAASASLEADLLLDAEIDASLRPISADAAASLILDAEITVALSAPSVSLSDAELLGADTELLGSKDTIVALAGTKDTLTALAGSQNTTTELTASSDILVNLSGSSDDIADLGGTKA